jgi:hypothetical protein
VPNKIKVIILGYFGVIAIAAIALAIFYSSNKPQAQETTPTSTAKVQPKYVANEVIIGFNQGLSQAKKKEIIQKFNLKEKGPLDDKTVLFNFQNTITPDLIAPKIKSSFSKEISFAEPNGIIELKPFSSKPIQSTKKSLIFQQAFAQGIHPSAFDPSKPLIAIIDSGLNLDLPFFQNQPPGRIEVCSNITLNGTIYSCTDPTISDEIGRGTQISYLVASETPNPLLIIKIPDANNITNTANYAKAIQYARQKVAKSIILTPNYPYGTADSSIQTAINNTLNDTGNFLLSTPAKYYSETDTIGRPGSINNNLLITSSLKGDNSPLQTPEQTGYCSGVCKTVDLADYGETQTMDKDGTMVTSIALAFSAVKAGIAAALAQNDHLTLTRNELTSYLVQSADNLPYAPANCLKDTGYGYGAVNPYRLEKLFQTSGCPTNCPTTSMSKVFSYGWNIISPPLEPVDNCPFNFLKDIKGINNVLYNDQFIRFDPSIKQYIPLKTATIPPNIFGKVTFKDGYWLHLDPTFYSGQPAAPPALTYNAYTWSGFEMDFPDIGWHLIGSPSNTPKQISSLMVKNISTSEQLPFTDAVRIKGWIDSLAHYWIPATSPDGSYCQVGLEGTKVNCDDSLRPWMGYWLKTYNANLKLIFP